MTIITIGRLYGSGGRDIGVKVAEKFGIPVYDKEIITLGAQDGGFCEEVVQELDERKSGGAFYAMPSVPYLYGNETPVYELPLNDKVFLAQSEVIRKLAAKGSCVIIGRCADYVLRERSDVVKVFIHATLEKRVERIARDLKLKPEDARKAVLRIDKERGNYYTYYTDQKWGRSQNYHLCIDAGDLGVEQSAKLIWDYVSLRGKSADEPRGTFTWRKDTGAQK